jgi:2'-5' RNA ligase
MGTETEALETLSDLCRDVSPFEVSMGEVESFAPRTPTVFIRVAHAAYRLRELHDRLDTGVLEFEEPWPYMPHMTIVKLTEWNEAEHALELAQERWCRYTGPRRVHIEELIFVRGSQDAGWVDLAPVRLGRNLSPVMAR